MAKDPAFLFYYQDFLVGTDDFTNEEVGAYIRCLCIQAAKGGISDKHMKNICKSHDLDKLIKSKFIFSETDKVYRNLRLQEEMEKRKNYSKSRATNRLGKTKEKKEEITYVAHMENENENSIVFNQNSISPQMVKIFKSTYPYYPVDEKADFTSCLQIAYKIAKEKGWQKETVLNGNMPATLEAWEKIVSFSTTDKWYSTRSISDFNREFQRMVQGMVQSSKVGSQKKEQQQIPSAPSLTTLRPS